VSKGLSSGRAALRRAALAAATAGAILLQAAAATPAAAGDVRLPGIDVSHWQGAVDWSAVKADGIRFVFAKATQHTSFADSRYAENKAGAEAAGIAFGAYHFADPMGGTADAIAQADHFVDAADLRGRNLLPVLDMERDNGYSPRALRRWARAWLDRVEERLGVKAIIYTNYYFWRDELGDPQWFAQNGHVLWIARYGASEPLVPAANWAGHGWTIWQHTDEGRVGGIKGNVDRNWFDGTRLRSLKIKHNR
jgi:lysozyme